MKSLSGIIIFSVSVVSFVIGVHQTMTYGLSYSYFFFMISLGLLFLYRLKNDKGGDSPQQPPKKSKKKR